MKQAIAGVAPPELEEVEVMTVWPSVAAYPLGRFHGRLYEIKAGWGIIFTVGNLFCLLTIPGALALYFLRVLPFVGQRYRITNRRVIIQQGVRGADGPYVDLDRFDAIEVVVQPGQGWYKAGDLVFSHAGVQTFRLAGVSRPESFRQVCLKAHLSYVGVKRARAKETAVT